MSQLYDLKVLIESTITAKGLDATDTRGKIALKAGRLLTFISPTTPDDPAGVEKLKQAIKDVLNISA
ncbi:MAG: hypothetical protein WAK26_03500 [Terracidiphilus sp.]